jgi:hypothetical protein
MYKSKASRQKSYDSSLSSNTPWAFHGDIYSSSFSLPLSALLFSGSAKVFFAI